MKTMTVNYKNSTIELSTTFANKSSIFGSSEYNKLQECRRDYPNYEIVIVGKSRKAKDNYKGLTLTYIRNYIENHNDEKAKKEFAKIFDEDKLMVSFLDVRTWFLSTFPEIDKDIKERNEIIAKAKESRKKALAKVEEPQKEAIENEKAA